MKRWTRLEVIVAAALTSVALLLVGASSASAATQYWLNNSKTVPTTHCYTGYGPSSYTDLLPTPPSGANSTTFGGAALFGCTPPFPAGAQIVAPPGGDATGILDVWMTNTHKKTCTTLWFLQHLATPTHAGINITGTGYDGNPGITVPANTTTPTKFTVNFNVPATTLPADDQLMLMVDVRTQTGPCSKMTLYYGSAATPSDLVLPTLVG